MLKKSDTIQGAKLYSWQQRTGIQLYLPPPKLFCNLFCVVSLKRQMGQKIKKRKKVICSGIMTSTVQFYRRQKCRQFPESHTDQRWEKLSLPSLFKQNHGRHYPQIALLHLFHTIIHNKKKFKGFQGQMPKYL